MEQAFAGSGGSGSVTAYTVPRAYTLRLDILTFTVVTDGTAGNHHARVSFTDAKLGSVTARLRDLNDGGASQTLVYTYGVGLEGSACVTATGWEVTDALPMTVLAPLTTITIASVNDAGATISGDAISGVVLYGDLDTDDDASTDVDRLLAGFLPGEALEVA